MPSPARAAAPTQAIGVAVDASNNSWVLWNYGGGVYALWNVNPSGKLVASYPFGPYTSDGTSSTTWSATAVSVGPDGTPHLLWSRPDGSLAFWNVSPSTGAATVAASSGPNAGYSGVSLATGPDGVSRILATNASGVAALYSVAASSTSFTLVGTYGPYADTTAGNPLWAAKVVSAGPSGAVHLLWTNPNGKAAFWNVAANGTATVAGSYGPITDSPTSSLNWAATGLATATDGSSRMLWVHPDGKVVLWNVTTSGAATVIGGFGPVSGWAGQAIAVAGGPTQLLWDNVSGAAALWSVTSSSSYSYVIYPSVAGLTLSASNVPGNTSVTETVTLNSPALAGGTVVALSSSNTAAAPVSANVTIPAGSYTNSPPFAFTTGSVTTTPPPVTLTASCNTTSQTAMLTVSAPPGAPTGLTAAGGNNQVALTWAAPTGTGAVTSYNVKRGTKSGGPYTTLSPPSRVTTTAYTDTTAAYGSTYYYVVSAVGAGGEGANSGEVSAIPQIPAPTGLTATSTAACVSLTWQPVVGVGHYNLYRTSSLQTAPTLLQSTQSDSTNDVSITLGQTYYYQVSAYNVTNGLINESPLSPPVMITPLGNLNPVIKLTTPVSGINLTAGTSLSLAATVMSRSGTISKVDFYQTLAQYDGNGNPVVTAGTLIGTATASPYSLLWSSITSGNLFLTAVATDSAGHTATSLPIAVNASAARSGAATLTMGQAIQAAQAFCQAVGSPVGAGTPTLANVTATSSSYLGNVWQIDFLGVASVEVADATGIVVSYFNYALANQLNANSQAPGTVITQTQAQIVAASVLQASNQSSTELTNQQLTQSNQTYPATYAGDIWTVAWNRVAAGDPYRTDTATLLLQAETGAVESWHLSFPTPALVPVAPAVSQSQAQSVAQAEMSAEGSLLGLSGQVFQAAQQVVVQPNTLWPASGSSAPGTMTPIPGSASRAAWDCYFSNAPASGSPSGFSDSEVWVDAATGQVIGGYALQVKGRRRSSPSPRPLVPMSPRPLVPLAKPRQ